MRSWTNAAGPSDGGVDRAVGHRRARHLGEGRGELGHRPQRTAQLVDRARVPVSGQRGRGGEPEVAQRGEVDRHALVGAEQLARRDGLAQARVHQRLLVEGVAQHRERHARRGEEVFGGAVVAEERRAVLGVDAAGVDDAADARLDGRRDRVAVLARPHARRDVGRGDEQQHVGARRRRRAARRGRRSRRGGPRRRSATFSGVRATATIWSAGTRERRSSRTMRPSFPVTPVTVIMRSTLTSALTIGKYVPFGKGRW